MLPGNTQKQDKMSRKYFRNGAWSACQEKRTGRLVKGKRQSTLYKMVSEQEGWFIHSGETTVRNK